VTAELRRAVAYIALRLASGKDASAVYDFEAGGYFQFSGEVGATQVNVYDDGRQCFLGGSPPSLYDYGKSSFFDFEAKGARFDGYDYGSSSFYEATVNGDSVSVYDYDVSAFFNYSL